MLSTLRGNKAQGESGLGGQRKKNIKAISLVPIHRALLLTLKLRPTGLERVFLSPSYHLN